MPPACLAAQGTGESSLSDAVPAQGHSVKDMEQEPRAAPLRRVSAVPALQDAPTNPSEPLHRSQPSAQQLWHILVPTCTKMQALGPQKTAQHGAGHTVKRLRREGPALPGVSSVKPLLSDFFP